jgi:hypothetical protein
VPTLLLRKSGSSGNQRLYKNKYKWVVGLETDRLCGLVVRIPGYMSSGPLVTRYSDHQTTEEISLEPYNPFIFIFI